jgi:hypothetical protein
MPDVMALATLGLGREAVSDATGKERRMDLRLLEQVEAEVLRWPNMSKEERTTNVTGIEDGVTIYYYRNRNIGHIHHDGVADLQFPRAVHADLVARGVAGPHRGGFPAVVSYELRAPEDVPGLIELFRLSYERAEAAARKRATAGTADNSGT